MPAGAATSTWVATSPELEGVGGRYAEDCHLAEVADTGFGGEGVAPYAVDKAAAERLWALTEQALGQTFDLS